MDRARAVTKRPWLRIRAERQDHPEPPGKEHLDHDYLRENVFRPAGMENTGPYEPNVAIPNRATGYTRRGPNDPGAAPQPVTADLPARHSSAGGSRSTAPDLLRFDHALRSNKLLPKEWGDWIFSNKPGSPASSQAGGEARRGRSPSRKGRPESTRRWK